METPIPSALIINVLLHSIKIALMYFQDIWILFQCCSTVTARLVPFLSVFFFYCITNAAFSPNLHSHAAPRMKIVIRLEGML